MMDLRKTDSFCVGTPCPQQKTHSSRTEASSNHGSQQQQATNKQRQQAGQTEEAEKGERRRRRKRKGVRKKRKERERRKSERGKKEERRGAEEEGHKEVKKDVTDWTVVTRNKKKRKMIQIFVKVDGSKVTPMEVSLTDGKVEDVMRQIQKDEDVLCNNAWESAEKKRKAEELRSN